MSDLPFDQNELIIGLVCPAGVDYNKAIHVLKSAFEGHGYHANLIYVSSLMDSMCEAFNVPRTDIGLQNEEHRIRSRMDTGNAIRTKTTLSQIMALAALQSIKNTREQSSLKPGVNGALLQPLSRTVHIIATLKRPEEVDELRQVYGAGFFLVGVHDSEQAKMAYLRDTKGIGETIAKKLIEDDEDDRQEFGQRTRDTYHLADVFVSLQEDLYKNQVDRFVDLIFGHPYHTPTRDEYAMYLAAGAALRSAQLGRQVGASLISSLGDLIGVGCNDVPAPFGGLYWPGDPKDKRDHVLKEDSNDKRKAEILSDLMSRLGVAPISPKGTADLLKGSFFSDITEFGRAVHAEMDALLSCARSGTSVMGASLFTTTFPCHNCARHIIASGISRVVYIEPYVKSAAVLLHKDAITVVGYSSKSQKKSTGKQGRIPFETFVGIGPRRYNDLFSLKPNHGREVKRKEAGRTLPWPPSTSRPKLPMHPISYLQRESLAITQMETTNVKENSSKRSGPSDGAKRRKLSRAGDKNHSRG